MNKKPSLLTQRRNTNKVLGDTEDMPGESWVTVSPFPGKQTSLTGCSCWLAQQRSQPARSLQMFQRILLVPYNISGNIYMLFPCNTALNLRGLKVKGCVQVQAKCLESFRHLFCPEKWNSKLEGDMQLSPQAFPLATVQSG